MNLINAVLAATLDVLDSLLGLYVWVVVFAAVLSWLIAFGIINTQNAFVRQMGEFLYRLTEPVFARIRRFIPMIGGIDLSPLVVIFAILFFQSFIRHLLVG